MTKNTKYKTQERKTVRAKHKLVINVVIVINVRLSITQIVLACLYKINEPKTTKLSLTPA